MPAVRAAVTVLGTLALGLAAVGCGGSDEDDAAAPAATVPAGLRATSTPAFQVAFPTAWTATSAPVQSTVRGEVRTIAEGPAGATGIKPGAVVGATPGAGADAATLATVNADDTRNRQPKATVAAPRELTVAGARGARVIESRVTAMPTTDGKARMVDPGTPGSVVLHQWDVVAASRGGTAVNLYLYVPEPDVGRVPVQAIISSLALR